MFTLIHLHAEKGGFSAEWLALLLLKLGTWVGITTLLPVYDESLPRLIVELLQGVSSYTADTQYAPSSQQKSSKLHLVLMMTMVEFASLDIELLGLAAAAAK